jgi:hypothetical protein
MSWALSRPMWSQFACYDFAVELLVLLLVLGTVVAANAAQASHETGKQASHQSRGTSAREYRGCFHVQAIRRCIRRTRHRVERHHVKPIPRKGTNGKGRDSVGGHCCVAKGRELERYESIAARVALQTSSISKTWANNPKYKASFAPVLLLLLFSGKL